MKKFLHKLRAKTAHWLVILIIGVVWLILQLYLTRMLSGLGMSKVVRLQTTLSMDVFTDILKIWDDQGLLNLYYRHFYFDFIYPVVYSLLIVALLSKLFDLNNLKAGFNYLLLLPLTAAVFDLIENSSHLMILSNFSKTKSIVLFSGIVSNMKWVLIFISLLIIFILTLRLIRLMITSKEA